MGLLCLISICGHNLITKDFSGIHIPNSLKMVPHTKKYKIKTKRKMLNTVNNEYYKVYYRPVMSPWLDLCSKFYPKYATVAVQRVACELHPPQKTEVCKETLLETIMVKVLLLSTYQMIFFHVRFHVSNDNVYDFVTFGSIMT